MYIPVSEAYTLVVIWNLSQPGLTNKSFLTASIHGLVGEAVASRIQIRMGRRPIDLLEVVIMGLNSSK